MIPQFIIERFRLLEATLHVSLEGEQFIPPSVNRLYKAGPHGRLKLRDEGLGYFNMLRDEIAKRIGPTLYQRWLYRFHMIVSARTIVNANFVQEAEKSLRTQTPMRTHRMNKGKLVPAYTELIKDKDADGPLKKVQDVLFEVLGMKDSYIESSIATRAFGDPALDLFLLPLTEEEVLYHTQVSQEVLKKWIDR